jgi:GNAT superfamily N-acetyltransferase
MVLASRSGQKQEVTAMTTAATDTRALEKQDVPEAGQVLSRAFWDDPLMTWLMPDEGRRAKGLPWFMTVAARYGAKYGQPYTTAVNVDGAALWLPPGETKISTGRMIGNGLLAAPLRMGVGGANRFVKVMNIFEKLHERDVPERHWYLMVLGVDPPRQGQGVGGGLMGPILNRADAEGLACYLETQKAKNVPFYQKHGFEVVVEDDTPDGGLHYWTMKRAPRQ